MSGQANFFDVSGRLEKRHEMANELAVLKLIEKSTGKTFTEAGRAALVNAIGVARSYSEMGIFR